MGICPNMKKIFFSNFETKKSFSVSEKKIVWRRSSLMIGWGLLDDKEAGLITQSVSKPFRHFFSGQFFTKVCIILPVKLRRVLIVFAEIFVRCSKHTLQRKHIDDFWYVACYRFYRVLNLKDMKYVLTRMKIINKNLTKQNLKNRRHIFGGHLSEITTA